MYNKKKRNTGNRIALELRCTDNKENQKDKEPDNKLAEVATFYKENSFTAIAHGNLDITHVIKGGSTTIAGQVGGT